MTDTTPSPQTIISPPIYIEITPAPLSIPSAISQVKSPKAGAVVLFAGTTRDNFEQRPVSSLSYESYTPLALRTLESIATETLKAHSLTAISITHRLGLVPIGEESILIAVSAPHRRAAWQGGEAALEECKKRAEIWKKETFGDGMEEGVWRANKDEWARDRTREC